MLCTKYDELSHPEKVQFMGKLCHAAQSDNNLFEVAEELISLATKRGLFDSVIILPDHQNNDDNELPNTNTILP